MPSGSPSAPVCAITPSLITACPAAPSTVTVAHPITPLLFWTTSVWVPAGTDAGTVAVTVPPATFVHPEIRVGVEWSHTWTHSPS